jgi:hypothetical protein
MSSLTKRGGGKKGHEKYGTGSRIVHAALI